MFKMIGSTVPTVGGIEKAFYWGDRWGCEAVQFYLTLSRKWEVDKISEGKVNLFKSAWKESSVKEVVAHIPYLVNLVSENRLTRDRSIERMIKEIERAKILGVKYLVLHPGSAGRQEKEEAIIVLKQSFDKIFKRVSPKGVNILIETMSGQGSSLGSSFEEVAKILAVLKDENTFAVCLDSAHILEAGYDIRKKTGYEETFAEFEKHIPIKKIKTFHLNDSRTNFGSKVDRHEHIGKGKIGTDFFKKLLNDRRFIDIPKILETPETEEKSLENLKTLRALID